MSNTVKSLNTTLTSKKIIHHVWVICSSNKVFIFPTSSKNDIHLSNLTITTSKNPSDLSRLIEMNFGILCSLSDLERIYQFEEDKKIYTGYILNLNLVGELKDFVTERTGGSFYSLDDIELILKNHLSLPSRESLLLLMDYLHTRDFK